MRLFSPCPITHGSIYLGDHSGLWRCREMYIDRSGGEKKKASLLQSALHNPLAGSTVPPTIEHQRHLVAA